MRICHTYEYVTRLICLVCCCDHISEDIKEKYIGTIVTIDSVRYSSNVRYCSTTIVTIGTITHATKPSVISLRIFSDITKYERIYDITKSIL